MISWFLSGNKPSLYGIMGVAGFAAAVLYIIFISKKKSVKFEDFIYVAVWAVIGAVAGAKILYLIVDMKNIISDIRTIANMPDAGASVMARYIFSVLRGGFVFYGGLFGGIAGIIISARFFHLDADKTLFYLTPGMPLFHAFGRVGCHITGCCYGIMTGENFGVIYEYSDFAPIGVRLFPVQLTEAFCDLVIFTWLLVSVLKNTPDKLSGRRILGRYLLSYAVIRFALEFLRGDEARGFILSLSVSQWISILVAAFIGGYTVFTRLRNDKDIGDISDK